MNDILQNVLVEHYVNSKGLITEHDVDIVELQKWKSLIEILYNQALELNRRDWDNPTELKECSLHDPIWDTIREIYDNVIGKVNGHILPRNTDLVCLIVAYAVKHRVISQDLKLSNQEQFRWKFESLLAREILSQREKNSRVIEDEILDLKYTRSSRRRNVVKFNAVGEWNLQKIDFSEITVEGYQKVHAISSAPHRYKEYIDASDETLSKNYLLFFFGQISDEIYARSWAHVLIGLGLKPTNKGIEFLVSRVDEQMRPYMYETLVVQRVISPIVVIHVRFYQCFYKILKEVLDEQKISKTLVENYGWDEDSVLYIYKGRTSCHTRSHSMEQATAIFTGRNDSDIKLNVEHCKDCGKFYMSYSVYESYREKHGILLGKIKMDSSSATGIQDIVLSEFSPLRLCGYSVNQQDGYSRAERQYIISKVIEKGILRKSEVIRYLEHFINRNGQKLGNALALEKWKEDLDFTLRFRMTEQAEYQFRHIKKY